MPSLKPIGLAAFLTFEASGDNCSKSSLGADVYSEGDDACRATGTILFRSQSPLGVIQSRQRSISSGVHARALSAMEKRLVRHIRESIPLESLRELAEEIGFCEADARPYQRLETNILAPALSDRKLLVDTHSWGQEETRRRGSLMSAARGAIVRVSTGAGSASSYGSNNKNFSTSASLNDTASKATTRAGTSNYLQMVTQGDPSLSVIVFQGILGWNEHHSSD